MATVNPTISFIGNDAVEFSWALTSTDADGAPIGENHVDYADRTMVATGTWGGATLTIEGSRNGSNYTPLSDAASTSALTAAADSSAPIAEVPRLTRPNLTTPGSGAAVNVSILCRRSRS
jgi:hypothetical protein